MNAHEMIKTLRDEGCAVVWFEPSELNGADPRKLEDSLSEFGYAVIETLSEHLQQENKEIVKSGVMPPSECLQLLKGWNLLSPEEQQTVKMR